MSLDSINLFSSDNKKLYYILISIFGIVILGYVLAVFSYPSISPDSGYYLKISYDLANGSSFFKELNCSYSPMAMYLFSILFYVNKEVRLEFLFAFIFLIYPIIAIVFYEVLNYFNTNKKINLFFTIICITSIFILEGYHILLEPYVLLFQLIALWILLNWKNKKWQLFLSGFFIFLAFYTKQYGLFIFPAMLYFILKEVNKIKEFIFCSFFLIAGFLIPIILLAIYFFSVEDVLIQDFIYKIFGISALKGKEVITGTDYLFTRLLAKNGELLIRFPFLFLTGYLLLSKKKRTKKNWIGLLLLGGSFCQLYFAYYNHYYQLIIPYFIITIVSLPKHFFQKKGKIILITSIFFIGSSFFEFYKAFRKNKIMYERQQVNVPILISNLPINEKVYLQGISPAYYFLCKYNSPNRNRLGYKFPEELQLSNINSSLSKGDYIIIEANLVNNVEFKEYLKISELMLKNKNIVILKKK